MVEFWSGAAVAIITFILTSWYERRNYEYQRGEDIKNEIYDQIYYECINFKKESERFKNTYYHSMLIELLSDGDFIKSLKSEINEIGSVRYSDELLELEDLSRTFTNTLLDENKHLENLETFFRYFSHHLDEKNELLEDIELLRFELNDQFHFSNDICGRLTQIDHSLNNVQEEYLLLLPALIELKPLVNQIIYESLNKLLDKTQTKKVK